MWEVGSLLEIANHGGLLGGGNLLGHWAFLFCIFLCFSFACVLVVPAVCNPGFYTCRACAVPYKVTSAEEVTFKLMKRVRQWGWGGAVASQSGEVMLIQVMPKMWLDLRGVPRIMKKHISPREAGWSPMIPCLSSLTAPWVTLVPTLVGSTSGSWSC